MLCKPFKYMTFRLLYVSGLIRECPWGKIKIRRRAYLYLLVFPLFIFIAIKTYIILWKARITNRKENRDSSYKFYLTIAAIAKNESEYISEWLAFHKLQGVDKVFLYNNDSTDNMREVLKPYIEDGFVIYNEIHGNHKQFAAYTDAINRYGRLAKYMAFIDCDEFLMPVNKDDNLKSIIDEVFAKDDNAGGYGINWCVYGSSGHEKKPQDGLLIENFIHHSEVGFVHNKHIKTIVKPSCVHFFKHPHFPKYKPGYYCINYDGHLIPYWWNYISEYRGIRLNHYICKSKEEFLKRRSLERSDIPGKRPFSDFDIYDRNDIKDNDLSIYYSNLRDIMNFYRRSD